MEQLYRLLLCPDFPSLFYKLRFVHFEYPIELDSEPFSENVKKYVSMELSSSTLFIVLYTHTIILLPTVARSDELVRLTDDWHYIAV
jgi:hypothetical protein